MGGYGGTETLLPRQGPGGGLDSGVLGADPLAGGRAKTVLALCVVGPWSTFSFFVLLFTFRYDDFLVILCCFAVGFVVVSMANTWRSRYARPDFARMAGLCAIAAVVGSVAGTCNYAARMRPYWAYNEHRQYTNVWPSELAASHRDAAAIVFAEGTIPDVRLTMGYTSGYHTYCVVPITMRAGNTNDEAPDVQYWAAGRECCASGGASFTCDDVHVGRARAGLVIYNQSSILYSTDIDHYMEATRMARAKFGVGSAKQPIFIRWVWDIEAARVSYFMDAWFHWFVDTLAYLPICILTGFPPALLSGIKKWIGA